MKFTYKGALVPKKELDKSLKKLEEYTKKLKGVVKAKSSYINEDEASINLPEDKRVLQDVLAMVKKKKTRCLRYVFVIGIGGSNLGTKAVYDALFSDNNIADLTVYPKLIFLDTNNPELMSKIPQLITKKVKKSKQVSVVLISKSGGTLETMTNFETLIGALNKELRDINQRIVAITGEGSKLWNKSKEVGIDTLPVPPKVGGRYSVLSPVGLFPLGLIGVDIKSLLQGALSIRNKILSSKPEQNSAAISAAITYYHNKNGKNINNLYFFVPALESLGKWHQQLMAESLGKEHDKNGKRVFAGVTPMTSIGSTDHHSLMQLYLGGPNDKTTAFISVEKRDKVAVPKKLFLNLTPSVKGRTLESIMNAVLEGTEITYTKQKRPFTDIKLERLNEFSLGEFMQFKMLEIMYLAQLLNINAFDQPHVELYKTETKKILEK